VTPLIIQQLTRSLGQWILPQVRYGTIGRFNRFFRPPANQFLPSVRTGTTPHHPQHKLKVGADNIRGEPRLRDLKEMDDSIDGVRSVVQGLVNDVVPPNRDRRVAYAKGDVSNIDRSIFRYEILAACRNAGGRERL
jgi:hypothetical protein